MFNLTRYLHDRQNAINKALEARMPSEADRPAILHRAMRYSVLSCGKRLRPIVCLAAAEATGGLAGAKSRGGGLNEEAMIAALAIEVFHAYTLIHDDLPCMDDSALRRGKPSSHMVFGEAIAVLAGDALQALAFEWISMVNAPPPYPPNQLTTELALAAGSRGVAGGQVEDLAAAGTKTGRDTIDYVHFHKTAALFRAAARIGGITGSAGRHDLKALTTYGTKLGLAFQIVDDITDANADRKGLTCLTVYNINTVSSMARTLIEEAIEAVSPFGEKGAPLAAIARYVVESLR